MANTKSKHKIIYFYKEYNVLICWSAQATCNVFCEFLLIVTWWIAANERQLVVLFAYFSALMLVDVTMGCFDGIVFLPSTILRTRKRLRAAIPRRSAPGNQVADDLSCTQTPDFKGASEKAFRRSTRNSISFLFRRPIFLESFWWLSKW